MKPSNHDAVKHTWALMQTALDKADAETLAEKALIVELHHRQSCCISYLGRLLSSRYRIENPFLDKDVLDTFLAMPPIFYRQGQRAYRLMLVRQAPPLAALPENKTGRPVTYADAHGLAPAPDGTPLPLPASVQWRLNRAQALLGDLLVTASGGWLGPHNRNDYVHHDESIQRVAPEWFRTRLLDPQPTGPTHPPWSGDCRNCPVGRSTPSESTTSLPLWRGARQEWL